VSVVRFCLLCVVTALAAPLPAADDLFIGQVRVENVRTESADSQTIRYLILHENPALLESRLAEWISQLVVTPDGVEFSLTNYPVASTPVNGSHHQAASFLIDYNEPSVQALVVQIDAQYGVRPIPAELEQFVYEYIENKNGAHGFDVASMVAKTRAGDCTEHAVLLTALLRMYGYPARTVTGLYVALEEPVLGYGHAWTEYYGDKGWTGLDGTRISDMVGARHVPLGVVDDETIGYTLGLLRTLQSIAITRVIVK